MTDNPGWRDNPRRRLAFLDSLLRLTPTHQVSLEPGGP